jgi:hypothetical protein
MNPLKAIVLAGLVAGLLPQAGPTGTLPPPAPPNAQVHVSGALLNAVIGRPTQRTELVAEEIRGTRYCGESSTCGQLRVELVPDPCRAVIDLVLTGTTQSRALGVRGPFRVDTATTIPFEARKRVVFDSRWLASDPACAFAWAHSEILSVTNRYGETDTLPVMAARSEARQDRPASEAVVSERARHRLAAELDANVNPQLARALQALGEGVNVARALGFSLKPFHWSTTADRAYLSLTVDTPSQPAVSSSPPTPAPSADLGVSVHQSVLNESAEGAFAGRTFTLFQLAELLRKADCPFLRDGELGGKVPTIERLGKLLEELKQQPWSMTFAPRRPVTVTFAEGVSLVLHAAQFKEGEKTYPAVDIHASYRFEKTAEGFVLVRTAPVEVLAPRGGTEPDPLLRTGLQQFFNLLFVERLTLKEIPLPAPTGDRPGRLVPLQAEARRGWLQVSWAYEAAPGK